MPSAPSLTVLVTGASRGIGLAIARRLAASGYTTIALARTQGEALSTAIEEANSAIAFVPFDLTNLDAIPDLARELKARFGPIWGLVNNAGLGTDGLLSNMHLSQIEALIRLNVTAPIVLTKYIVRGMMTGGGGRIVNMSSVIGSTGYSGLSVYGATKASMLGFTKSLAREVGRLGVTVNAVAPGFIDTEMTAGLGEDGRDQVMRRSALRRLAEVDDIAAMVEFLMGAGGKNITGAVMTVDAGNTA
ncbi:MAG TPA: SDR family NAD(P)-dependent oxidoreductase [Caulobacteraceae bacterium]|nr:SDR family NAD(P)-dependent oxidoreductase [Caulobacteraceae bacterium]